MRRAAGLLTGFPLALGLVLLTLAAFLPALDNGFVAYDDNQYVYDNPQVRAGLTWPGVRWAAAAVVAGHYHPLTVLSHMLDAELFGLDPRGHHLTSLLLHCAAVVLLFVALRRLTGSTGKSFLVAALFAVHPLRVESVAWVAERKDVLGALFWTLTLTLYAGYARRPSPGRYLALAAAFAAGLLAKAMLVTLPAVLLLLDVWPLGRLRLPGASVGEPPPAGGRRRWLPWVEKLPLLALSAASSALAVSAAAATVQPLSGLGPGARLANATVSYVALLGKTLWPRDLAVFYPMPAAIPAAAVAASGLVLALLTAGALWQARRRPYLAVGWLWWLGVLVPVIGLVHVGAKQYADRYTYLPSIGLWLALVWGLAELTERRPRARRAAVAGAAVALVAMVAASRAQVAVWRDTETLFRRAAAVTEGNYLAHLNLGSLLARRGEQRQAAAHFRAALAAAPSHPDVLAGAADALVAWGRPDEALPLIERALAAAPGDPRFHHTAAMAHEALGDEAAALAELRRAVALAPGFAAAQHGLGALLLARGDGDGALAAFRAALAADPARLELYPVVATLLAERGRDAEAAAFRAAGERLRRGAGRGKMAADPPDPPVPTP